ncbi:Spermatoproteinsis associated protein 5 [Perkinsus olseni]|uniref:Spermatoproteinsis associated protein 5 n=1 Tax=Perkinsus olseni TaxID=32597 RepID=A0A7J6SJ04_PEROL|nr:Spermatoproteinsis associated protein 5 [Perkinsus olseni]
MDPALLRPGRIDRLVHVPLPDDDARREIWKGALGKVPHATVSDGDDDIEHFVSATKGYSGAEIVAVVREGCMAAVRREIDHHGSGEMALTRGLIDEGLSRVQPRITEELAQAYVGASEKPYTLHIMHLPSSEEYDEEEFFAIRATFIANNGRKAMLSYASNGSEYQMVLSSGKNGRVIGETGEKEKVHSKVGDVNPFYHLLSALHDDFEPTQCGGMADYIEDHPVDDYEPGMAWVVEYLKKISWPAFLK